MWAYSQTTGQLWDAAGHLVGTGYSGFGEGKNNFRLQAVHDIGPIPQGGYDIGEARDTETHGPVVMPLAPWPENQMFGRSGFLIHGDSIKAPGSGSHGCLILPRTVREKIASSEDKKLYVQG